MNTDKHLKKALNLFIEEIKKEEYFLHIYSDRPSLSFFKKNILKIVKDIYAGRFTCKQITDIAQKHFKTGLNYAEFLESLDKIKCYLNRVLLQEGLLDYKSYTRNTENFKKAKNCASLGYLKSYIEQDRIILKLILKKEKESELLDKYILHHISWIISIINDVEKLHSKKSVQTLYKVCELSKFLNRPEIKKSLSKKDLNLISDIHKQVHIDAEEIYYNLFKRDYSKLLSTYISFIKNSLAMLNFLAVLVIQESSTEIRIDPLTGLLNRRTMNEILSHNFKIARLAEEPFTIAMLDIDNFKNINDKYGHIVGDCVLKKLAKIIKQHLRKSDFVFRYGGEEFLILLPSTKLEDAYRVLENIRKIIEKTYFYCDDKNIKITVSIGLVSVIPDESYTITDIIKKADEKLYKAKREGKNRVIY